MVTLFAILVAVHGLVHVLGAAKAFHWAELPQLTRSISPGLGVLWLLSALLFLAASVASVTWPRWWWAIGIVGVVVSAVVIVPSWTDAKIGMAANVLVLAGVAFGFACNGPFSLRAEYDRDIEASVSGTGVTPGRPIADDALAHLPVPVRQYLRLAGVVGHPPVRNYRVRTHGRIREGRLGRWMPFSAEQYNVVDPPARFFYLNASLFAIPIQGYHRYLGSSASMRVKAAALVPIAAAGGAAMAQSETVTLFNDMCLMAPATLLDRRIGWEMVDAHTVRARFGHGDRALHATLTFDDEGRLTNFVSGDRYQSSAGGAPMRRMPWSTPVTAYRRGGTGLLPARGEGRWHDAEGDFAYIELTIDDVQYNVAGH